MATTATELRERESENERPVEAQPREPPERLTADCIMAERAGE